MVGDRVHTDIIGARTVGLRSALVKTGEFDPREQLIVHSGPIALAERTARTNSSYRASAEGSGLASAR